MKKHSLLTAPVIGLCLSGAVHAQPIDEQETRDVEIGVGGNIKLESPVRSELEEKYEWHAHLLWESRYVSEGRDNLAGKGIYSVSTEFVYQDLSIVPWIAEGVDTDYSEFNLNIVYGWKLADELEIYVGYNHLRSDEENNSANDNEVSIDLAYFLAPTVKLAASMYYSIDAEGAFAEVAATKRYQFDDALSFNVGVIVGFNSGYVTDGHDGLNHGQLRAGLTFQANDQVEIYAITAYSAPIDKDEGRYPGDEFLRDMSWGGAGLSYRF